MTAANAHAACWQEPIHSPGSIQAYGALLAVDPSPGLRVIGASRNAAVVLGYSGVCAGIIGCGLASILGQRNADCVRERFDSGRLRGQTPWRSSLTLAGPLQRLDLAVHAQAGVILVELERADLRKGVHAHTILGQLQDVMVDLREAEGDLDVLARVATRGIRLLTGYDRVSVYRFDTEWNGLTIAEDKDAGWDQSFDRLLCPASDIPIQARDLYRRSAIRWVADRDAAPAPIDLDPSWATNQPAAHAIDLSFVGLRSQSPTHLQIHGSLGVNGSMSLSILYQGRLWGLMICHHRTPHLPSPAQRSAAATLTDAFALRVGPVRRTEQERGRRDDMAQLSSLLVQMAEADMVNAALASSEITIANLFASTGAVVLYAGEVSLLGRTPSEADIRELAVWLKTDCGPAKLFQTNNLSALYPPSQSYAAMASGVLAVFLSAERSDMLLWFRPEKTRLVKWGGSFLKPAKDRKGDVPDYGHAEWGAVRHGFAEPWTEWQAEMAETLRHNVTEVMVRSLRRIADLNERLRKSQAALAEELHAAHMATSHARTVAERANRAKTRFLSGMSHELRTPLNGILGYAQLLRMEGGLNAVQAARVDFMLAAGTHLLETIHCVLDLSEIESDHARLEIKRLDLRRKAMACLDLIRPSADAKGLSLSLCIDAEVPGSIVNDATRLRQILLNLLGNAVKFTRDGGIDLHIRTLPDGAGVRFDVVDTGPGVPPGEHLRLFEEFERLESHATRAVEGAGLGLTLSSRIASLMGGRIGHEDNPGGGSVFWLELPLAAGATGATLMETPPGAAKTAAPTPVPNRVLRVLVVDDVAMNRDIAASFLQSAGHAVTCAEGGPEAIEAAAAADFDVIMMDVRMPGMDGLAATRHIRMIGGARGDVPIIAFTAQAFTEQVAECRKAGMDGHLMKPFTLESLLEALSEGFAAGQRRGRTRMEAEDIEESGEPASVRPQADAEPGSELPVLDVEAFGRVAELLGAGAIPGYLRNLLARCEALSQGLRAPDAIKSNADGLSDTAHALAGSAGMFGFERLAFIARDFERVAKADASESAVSAGQLVAVLESTVCEIRNRY